MKRLLVIALGLLVIVAAVVVAVSIYRGRQQRAEGELARAAERGDAAAVRSLTARGEDANARDKGYTPLVFAARAGDAETVNALLDAEADPNARDCSNGWTPLIHAIHKHRSAAARALVLRGADVNARAGDCEQQLVESGMTPLMFASMYDDAELVKFLLERGADPRAEYDGSNALAHAVGGAALGKLTDIDRAATNPCPTETVRALLTKAPDLRIKRTVFDRATTYIVERKCPEIATMLDGRAPAPPSPPPAGDSRIGSARER
jgi:hypothetical protein